MCAFINLLFILLFFGFILVFELFQNGGLRSVFEIIEWETWSLFLSLSVFLEFSMLNFIQIIIELLTQFLFSLLNIHIIHNIHKVLFQSSLSSMTCYSFFNFKSFNWVINCSSSKLLLSFGGGRATILICCYYCCSKSSPDRWWLLIAFISSLT